MQKTTLVELKAAVKEAAETASVCAPKSAAKKAAVARLRRLEQKMLAAQSK